MSTTRAAEVRELVGEFFGIFPDYRLCRTLAENILEKQMTYAEALRQLALKVEAGRRNREQIEEHLNRRSVSSEGQVLHIRDMGLRQLSELSDDALRDVLEFYSKHPYAHGRCKRSRWIPAWIRSFPLRYLIAQARARGLKMDYSELFDLLGLL